MSGLRMVQHGNQVIISGGFDETDGTAEQKYFYKLSGVTESWEVMPIELSVARARHVSVVVPGDFFNCPDTR